MLSFGDLKKVRGGSRPPFILIYAEPGGGKTTLASEFPNAVFLQTEEGTPGDVELTTFGHIEMYDDLLERIGQLCGEEHDYNTVVVDSATALERMVWKETCKRGNKANIEDFGYGAGYKKADDVWQEIIGGLNALRRDRNMIVIVIAHAQIARFDDPETTSYSRFEVSLHQRASALIESESDLMIFLRAPITTKEEDKGFNHKRAVAQGGRNVFMHLVARPTFKAKPRYLVNAPDKIQYKKGQGFTDLFRYFPGGTGNLIAEPTTDEITTDRAETTDKSADKKKAA